MQIDNKGDGLTDNLWAEMSLMMVLVVIVLALAWRYVWKHPLDTFCRSSVSATTPLESYPELETWDDGSWTQKRFLLWLE